MCHCRKLLGLLKGVLSSRAVKHQHHFVRSLGQHLLHHILDFFQLVHQTHLVVQAAGRVNQHHIGTVGLRALQGVKCHRCRVAAHLLLDDGHAHTLTPDAQLLDCSGTECVGSAKIHLLAGVLELPGQLANGRGLADAIHPHHQDDVGLMVAWQFPIFVILRVVLGQQRRNLFAKNGIQLRCTHVLVSAYTLFNALNDFQSGVNTDITRYQHFLQIVEHVVVNLRLSRHGTCQFVEHRRLGFLQSFVKRLLVLFTKKSKNSHIAISVSNCKITAKKGNCQRAHSHFSLIT